MVRDNLEQAETAFRLLTEAEAVVIPLPALCEFAWVLRSVYRFTSSDLAYAIREVLSVASVVTNRAAAEFGLFMLESGGDFADGVIAFEGKWLGGETFVSFDRNAVSLLSESGQSARLL
jgi:predicted nucleic-acid-binding protein